MRLFIRALLIFSLSINAVIAQDSPPDPLLGIEQESRGLIETMELIGTLGLYSAPVVLLSFGGLDFEARDALSDFMKLYIQLGLPSFAGLMATGLVLSYASKSLHSKITQLRRRFTGKSQSHLDQGARFYSSDERFFLENTRDPTVIETKSSPSVFDLYLENRSLIKDVLFRPIANMGMHPARLFSNLHIHIDITTAFQWDKDKIANFLVDTLNHPGFTKGAHSQKWASSASIAPVREKEVKVLIPLLRKAENSNEVQELLGKYLHSRSSLVRYKASTETLELRFLRNARSVDEMLSVLNLVKSRIRFLDAMVEEIQLLEYKERKKINKDLNLKDYVDETEANWDQFRRHLGIRYKSREMIRELFNKVRKRCSFSTVQ